ncbi:extracellular calcium-sensing receptor-like [Pseudoliparis swirei]|uniref:extracellular calcium-sensing receptor-like n=1 Tax=Pseudoliparis swirei TaxID=2059687 RepID=UPI0024BE26E9|nr:extracellular calcium-sensing receptor-like [Pseudoliparis swirei]
MDGDYVIGGVLSIHHYAHTVKHNYTMMPDSIRCSGSIDTRELRFSRAMIFAIEEINNSTELLPGIKLGYQIYDSCASVPVAVHVAFQLSGGLDLVFNTGDNCSQSGKVMAIVGESGSTPSISMSRIIGPFNIPQVSHFATCACLSDKQQYPSFFRTIPSDQFQADALAKLVKHFGWTWIGAIRSDSDYGNNGMASFLNAAHKEGICVEYSESFYRTNPRSRIQRVADIIRRSTAMVIVAFTTSGDFRILLEELSLKPSPPRQWIGSEAWVTDPAMLRFSFCAGAVGFGIEQSVIPGLRDFLLDLSPSKVAASPVLTEFWEDAFNCRFAPPPAGWVEAAGEVCTGQEDLESVGTELLDVSDLRPEYNIYKAVYALAHALDDMLQCEPGRGPFSGHSCATLQILEPWQLLHYLEKVNFTTSFGDEVSFDENGDALPIYDVMNWLLLTDGRITIQNVGLVKQLASKGEELTLDEEKIFWNFDNKQSPLSVCSESCPPGTRMARKKGQPFCCFDCVPCSEGKFSNDTDSMECTSCPEDFWSNVQRDHCIPKKTEFLSYHEPLGICLTTTSLLGTFICAVVLGIFTYHRSTPMVRANNSELSFLLLLSLKSCFLCSLLFIGRPSLWTCQLRHAAFGISFVLCVSCILVKTIVVLAVFNASKPGGGTSLKWFGAVQQRGTVLVLTSVQAAICTAWIASASPARYKNTQYHNDKIVYECVVGSTVGFAVLLGYVGLLAILSFLLAFLARNLPDNFNEAKLITFSMLIFCAVWVAFIPAYVNSPGKYADAVEVFAILASSFGLLLALFGPKCYIILLRPERNTKKAIMGRGIQS